MKPSDFVEVVVNSYQNGNGIFANKVNAEDLLPAKIDNLNRALFLFYVIQLDYATKSQKLYLGARKLFNESILFFTPEFIVEMDEKELKNLLKKKLRPRYINEALKRYKLNSRFLLDNYAGDPRNIFRNSTTARDALKKIREFRGFGPKIGNFFFRTMVNTFSFNYPDIEKILPPVDVHDVRIAYLMGFISSEKMSGDNIKTVKNLWNSACRGANKSWLEFDKALWLIGSEGKPKTKEDVLKVVLNIRETNEENSFATKCYKC